MPLAWAAWPTAQLPPNAGFAYTYGDPTCLKPGPGARAYPCPTWAWCSFGELLVSRAARLERAEDVPSAPAQTEILAVASRGASVLAAGTPAAVGQFNFAFNPGVAANRFELSDSVHVDEADSATRTHLERVRAFLGNRQWDEAVETLRQVMEEHGEKLVAVELRPSMRAYVHADACATS